MNKKFSTLVASLLLASSMNGWAAITPANATANPDQASWGTGAPFVSSLAITAANGAKAISAIENVGEKADSRYYQFVVKGSDGKQVLTMVLGTDGKYELAVEDVTATNDGKSLAPMLDRTLWEVRANKSAGSGVLYYTFINKASQLPLQLASDASSMDVVNGSIDWRWSDASAVTAGTALSGVIRAAVNNTTTMYLADGTTNGLTVKTANSSTYETTTPTDAVTFEAWEANPIVLTAAQINAELGYEDIRTQKTGKNNAFRFTFAPDVEGSSEGNTMLAKDFLAEPAGTWTNPGDAPEGFVRFRKWKNLAKEELSDEYLMVDTAYYDATPNRYYDLKMAVKEIYYPRYAVLHDGYNVRDVAGVARLHKPDGTIVDFDENCAANIALAQLKRQSNFKPVYYPADQTLRLQAEMIFKADKAKLNDKSATNPEGYWWQQMVKQVNTTTEVMTLATGADAYDEYAYYQGYAQVATTGAASTNTAVTYANKKWNEAPTATSFSNNEKASAYNNVVKLVALTNSPKHTEVSCDITDKYDTKYDGLLTIISLENLKKIYTEVAAITPGFYYMQNANTVNTNLLRSKEYRYEDLAATAATYTYWNAVTNDWAVGKTNLYDNSGNPISNEGEYRNTSYASAQGNIVYSPDLKEIPSAQWYISGNGGYYTITNRESGRTWGTSYWWKCEGTTDTYVNHATYYDATGLPETYRDTIRLIRVSEDVLKQKNLGYLNLTQEEAKADTSVFNFNFKTIGDIEMFLGQAEGVDSLLKVMSDAPGKFKLERVLFGDKDKVLNRVHTTDIQMYGINPNNKPEQQLERAMYYIYKDEVSSNSTQETGIQTREYVTLEGGKYRLAKVQVNVRPDGYTTYEDNEYYTISGTKADSRKAFLVKQISSENKDQYVLIDPYTVGRELNNNGDFALGVRLFVNQMTAETQPAGLRSDAASNVYDNSVFSIERVEAYNYRDIRTAGNDRDTLTFYKESNPSILLYENSQVKGASVGLLDRINDAQQKKNYSLFVDTANVSNVEKPMFLLAVRAVDTNETSNLDDHNRHLYTTADYLVNMIDSVDANGNTKDVYKYSNIDKNNHRTYYRLGFVNAVHKGSKLFIGGDEKDAKNTIDLSKDNLTYASFAFRFSDTDRSKFYIETKYDANQVGWVKVINEVPVVSNDIQDAEVYEVKKATTTPTANEGISASEVSIVAGNGVVVVKNAAGKNVAISNILGKSIANVVLSSDNETISVPAGIVVVSVEGEEAVKAVVK